MPASLIDRKINTETNNTLADYQAVCNAYQQWLHDTNHLEKRKPLRRIIASLEIIAESSSVYAYDAAQVYLAVLNNHPEVIKLAYITAIIGFRQQGKLTIDNISNWLYGLLKKGCWESYDYFLHESIAPIFQYQLALKLRDKCLDESQEVMLIVHPLLEAAAKKQHREGRKELLLYRLENRIKHYQQLFQHFYEVPFFLAAVSIVLALAYLREPKAGKRDSANQFIKSIGEHKNIYSHILAYLLLPITLPLAIAAAVLVAVITIITYCAIHLLNKKPAKNGHEDISRPFTNNTRVWATLKNTCNKPSTMPQLQENNLSNSKQASQICLSI